MARKYVCVLQHAQADCGAAALAAIAVYHGRPVGLEEMRQLAGTDRAGTNLLGLTVAAEKIGLSARGLKGTYEALVRVPLPAIAHVKTAEGLGHFVVLYRVKRGSVTVADPARGLRTLSREEFTKSWTGYLLAVVPDPHAAPRSPGKGCSPSRRLLGLLAPHSAALAEAFACALLMTVLGVSTSYFIQHLVDSVLVRGEGRLLDAFGVGMILIALFRALFGVIRQYLVAHAGRQVDLALIAGYSRHVLSLPMPFFETRRVGEILSRVNDAAKIREAIGGTSLTAIVDATLVVSLLAVLWLYDLPLALAASAFIPALLVGAWLHHPAARRLSDQAMEDAAGLTSHLFEDASGVETIKAFGAERARSEMGETRLVELTRGLFSLQKLSISLGTVGMLVTTTAGVAVLWYGGHRVIDGALTIGQLMFFYSLLGYLLGPLERLASVNLKIQDALAAVDRLYQVMDLDPEPMGLPGRARFERVARSIKLRGVSFKYGCRSHVLRRVSLRIPAGKVVAIVGESGSGKSTLLKLLTGSHHPSAGRVLIDRVDLRDYDLASLRAGIGVVSQEPFIFNGTIRENIAMGRPGASPEEVIEAARTAGLGDFIAGLPDRFETIIGERGANLSGGQRQRLAIARALIKAPEILIFDEATSHLDTATERAIRENMRVAFAGKTVILVAHRLSTVREADYIYVLHHGRVVERGTHRQLMLREGRYRSLWRSQLDDDGPIAALPAITTPRPSGRMTALATIGGPRA